MFLLCTAQISLGEKVVTSLALNSELSRAENKGHRNTDSVPNPGK